MTMRQRVLSILFMASISSFMNRVSMSVVIPYVALEYHLSPSSSGFLISIFFAGYALMQIPGGLLADIFGARRVATFAMIWWSVFTAITGAAANVVQIAVARFLFGLGEGLFPACSFKTIAVWFPERERATATAIMLASNPLGAALTPLAVVAVMSLWGWRAVFYALFIPGLVAALLFWFFVRDKPSESPFVSPEELDAIESLDVHRPGGLNEKTSLLAAIKRPYIVRYFIVLLALDIAYWGFISWLPTYLVKVRGFSMAQMGLASSLPFFAGFAGAILGGKISDKYFSGSRRTPIIAAQISSAVLIFCTFRTQSIMTMVICQTLAGFFFNFFFSAFWALPMNTVPKQLMGITGGFINMAGQIAAFISPVTVGYLITVFAGSYNVAFAFLITALLVSASLAFTLPHRFERTDR